MRDASRERTFCNSRLSGVACALWVMASLTLASCGGKSGSTGDPPGSAPAHVKAEAAVNETEAIELAKKEFLKSGGGLNAADCRVTGVKASTVQHEPVWIVTFLLGNVVALRTLIRLLHRVIRTVLCTSHFYMARTLVPETDQ